MKEMKTIIEIKPINNLDATVAAPPSKAHTLRALFIGAMADGTTIIKNPLMAEDQKYAINALKALGTEIKIRDKEVIINGCNGKFKAPYKELFIGNSGVSARVLAVLASLADGEVVINGTERMRTARPIDDLLEAIRPLGVNAVSINRNGCLPIRVDGSFKGGATELRGDKSSQYFTAILMCAPYAKENVTIKTIGELHSKPYIDITYDVMKKFGVIGENKDYQEFTVKWGQCYHGREYVIEGDYSNATYFFGAAAITRGRIRVTNLNPNSVQGDMKFLDFLEMMGCDVKKTDDYIEVIGKPLKAIKVDMQDYPDIVPSLAVVSAFAEGTSEFYNIGHLKYKESDRIEGPVTELKKMGIKAEAEEDRIIVEGGKPYGAVIDSYKDHRMVMSFSMAGLKVPGIKIRNPENVLKSFPDFFDVLKKLGE
jgi:3-phosphoshikimate 1-carboxyvinyltransferase